MVKRRYLDQRLKLHHLRAVDAISSQHSLSKASAALGISQPALTKSLQELETILDMRLFERHARGMLPTPAGDGVIRSARRILAELRRLDEDLDRLSSPSSGIVALGALPGAAAGVLPGVLGRLKVEHNDLDIRLVEGRTEELLPMLAAGEIDLIVGRLYEPAVPDGFVREPLYEEPISILARYDHPVFQLEPVTVSKLRVLLLTSKGAAGVAGAAFVVLVATLASVGTIPVASVALILGIHRLMSEGLTPTNLIGNAVATIVIAKWEGALDQAQLRKTLNGEPASLFPTQ